MDTKDTALLTKLRGLFAGEAEERLQVITSSLLMLEREPGAAETAELVETLFREVHTLKGGSSGQLGRNRGDQSGRGDGLCRGQAQNGCSVAGVF